MFTGIVEEIGILKSAKKTKSGIYLGIKTGSIHTDAKLGDSVAVNGACLTVTGIKNNELYFDAVQETINRTTLAQLKINDSLNLERSMRADSRIGGHFVTGHVDYKAMIMDIENGSGGASFKISMEPEFSRFIAEKGSVALDGVSLTVGETGMEYFKVYLIPHTLKITTLGKKKKSDSVNIEVDLLAKYLDKQNNKTGLQSLLKQYGYI